MSTIPQEMEEGYDEVKIFMDYEILHACQYSVADWCLELESDCGKPALYRVYWNLKDGTDAGEILVCQEHFDFIIEREKNQKNGK